MRKDIEQDMAALDEAIQRLETLAAWRDLERAESNPDSPLGPRLSSTDEERALATGRFWLTLSEMEARLAALPHKRQVILRSRVERLIARCRSLSERTS